MDKREGRPGERDKRDVAVAVNGYGLAELYPRLFSSVGLESSRRQVHRERQGAKTRGAAPLTLCSPPDPSCRGLCYRSASGGILKSRGAPHTLGSAPRHVQPCGSSASRARGSSASHTYAIVFSVYSGDAPRCILGLAFDVRGEISPKKKKEQIPRGQCKRISASQLFSYIFSSSRKTVWERGDFWSRDFR